MTCGELSNINGIADLLVYPTGCFYWFYLVVLGAIFLSISLSMYFKERERMVAADIISILGVNSIGVFFLGLIGTLIKNTDGIPMIQQDIFLYISAFSIVFIVIWFFKK